MTISLSDVHPTAGMPRDPSGVGSPLGVGADPHFVPEASSFGNRYTRAFKLRILQEADACIQPGDIGQ